MSRLDPIRELTVRLIAHQLSYKFGAESDISADHVLAPYGDDPLGRCSCGEEFGPRAISSVFAEHRRHVDEMTGAAVEHYARRIAGAIETDSDRAADLARAGIALWHAALTKADA